MSDDEYVPTLRERIAEAIPNSLFTTPVVGIGGARRLKVAIAVMPVVDEAIAAAEARGYDRAIARLRYGQRIADHAWQANTAALDVTLRVAADYLEAAKETR